MMPLSEHMHIDISYAYHKIKNKEFDEHRLKINLWHKILNIKV